LSSGTTSTGTDFTADEVCRIIKACSNKKIAFLKVGSLEIDFRLGPAEVYLQGAAENLRTPIKKWRVGKSGEIEEVTEVAEVDSQERRRELLDMEVERMLTDDPEQMEALICDQLINEGQGIKASYGIEDT
jgi:hypothetical protein